MMSGEICSVILEISCKLYIFYDVSRSSPRGPSPFSVAKKNENATAASDAMNSVGWLGLSLPHQPRRKKGDEGSVLGNSAK